LSDPALSVKVVRHTRAIYFCGKVRIGSPGIIDEGIKELATEADYPLKPKPGLNGPPSPLHLPDLINAIILLDILNLINYIVT
jgi:hypothetical protein